MKETTPCGGTVLTWSKIVIIKSILAFTLFLPPTCAHIHTHSPHSAFWDIVVVTARDEEQRRSYEEQIELKKSRAEIPGFVK